MIRKINYFCLGALALLALSCAGTGGPAPESKENLSISAIISSDMKTIDLGRYQITCAGNIKEIIDTVEQVPVKGLICEEIHYISFVYLFNDEPFFFALMEINASRDEMKPLAGFGAFKQMGLMTPVDLKDKPRLPDWARDKNGKTRKSIYTYTEQ